MYIDLSYNQILGIQDDAFAGVETAVTILKLNNNNLRLLPDAIARLTNLVDLEIQDNPIMFFNDKVMSSIGPHLEILCMGSSVMTEWPEAFQNITNLNTFKVFNIALETIPANAFGSTADTLKNLLIANTNLTGVPSAICDLRNLEAFQFLYNQNLNDSETVMPKCSSSLDAVTSARFEGNDLLEIPDVFHDFPNLTTLYVVGNKNLGDQNTTIFASNAKITNLYLYGNGLNVFPSELSQLKTLHYLDLHDNNITVMTETDVSGLNNLLRLILNGNPLTVIEPGVFQNLPKLLYISLDNTGITFIPEALNGTVSLSTISLKDDQINCTCEALMWMKNWQKLHTVDIIGTCGFLTHQQSIFDYINFHLSRC